MEKEEKQRVIEKLPELVELTSCSATFLSSFLSKNILTSSEIAALEAEGRYHGPSSEVYKFYTIIQTRVGAYKVLLSSLQSTGQTGALQLLTDCDDDNSTPWKTRKVQYFVNQPSWIKLFLQSGAKRVHILCTNHPDISIRRLSETVSYVKVYELGAFIQNLLVGFSTSNFGAETLFLVNCKNDILSVFRNWNDCILSFKVVLVTSHDKEEIIKSIESLKISWNSATFINENFCWSDLSYCLQDQIMSDVEHILPFSKLSQIALNLESDILAELVERKIPQLFKDNFPNPISFYIPRFLIPRNRIKDDICSLPSDDIYLFTGIERHQLSELVKERGSTTSSNFINTLGVIKIRYIILENDKHFEKIAKNVKSPVHQLHRENGCFRWVKSRGSLSFLQSQVIFLSDKYITDDNFIDSFDQHSANKQSVLISDTPGMGKTVLLAKLGNLIKERFQDNRDIFFITMNEFANALKLAAKDNDNLEEAIKFTLKQCVCDNNLGWAVLMHRLETGLKRIEILFDGYDELNAEDFTLMYKTFTFLLTQYSGVRFWVTTRPHLLNALENSLEVFGYNIKAFDENDQAQFLQKFWMSENTSGNIDKLKDFAYQCLSSVKSKLKAQEHDIAGVPLQCLLIGEVFGDNANDFLESTTSTIPKACLQLSSVSSMYSLLVDKKFGKFFLRYKKDNISLESLIDIHIYLSLLLLFPHLAQYFRYQLNTTLATSENLLDVGLLESTSSIKQPKFIHRTIAEYFVSKFFFNINTTKPTSNTFTLLLAEIMKTKPVLINYTVANHVYAKGVQLSQEFINPVICYFLDTFFNNLEHNFELSLSSQRDTVNLDHLEGIFQHDFFNLFRFFEHKTANFKACSVDLYANSLLMIGCSKSSTEFVKYFCNKYMKLENLIKEKKIRQITAVTPLHHAVRRGSYSLVEYFIYEKNLKKNLLDLNWLMESIVEYTIRDSLFDEEVIIQEKVQILRLLRTINYKLFEVKNFSTSALPIFWKNIHVKLLCELFSLNIPAYDTIKVVSSILHYCTTYLSTDDFHLFLNHLKNTEPNKLILDSVTCRVGKSNFTLMHQIIDKYEITEASINLLNEIGFKVNCHEYPNHVCILSTAIICKRSIACLRHLIRIGCDYKTWQVVHRAVTNKNLAALEIILQYPDVDVSIKNCENNTPLHQVIVDAKSELKIELASLLLKSGANVSATNDKNETPLDLLLKLDQNEENCQVLVLFTSYEAMWNSDGVTAKILNWVLHIKCLEDNLQTAYKSIIDRCIKTESLKNSENGESWLQTLFRNGMCFLAKHLYSVGIDISINRDGDTALHIAILNENQNNRTDFIDFLISVSPDAVNVLNNSEETPLEKALACCPDNLNLQILESMVHKTARLKASTATNLLVRILTHYYTEANIDSMTIEKILDCCFKAGGNFQFTLEDGSTLVHKAAAQNFYSGLKYLMKIGCNVNCMDSFGNSPLHSLVKSKCTQFEIKTATSLLESGADVNCLDGEGMTPLRYLILREPNSLDFQMLQLFQNYMAINRDDIATLALVWIASYVNEHETDFENLSNTIEKCVETGANLHFTNESGESLVHLAAKRGFVNFLEILLNFEIDINKTLPNGDTALHLAFRIENTDDLFKTTELLLKKNINLNMRNNKNQTPLQYLLQEDQIKLNLSLYSLLESYGAVCEPEIATDVILWLIKYRDKDIDIFSFSKVADYCFGMGATNCWNDEMGNTFLHMAASSNNYIGLEYFIRKGVDINGKNDFMETALYILLVLCYPNSTLLRAISIFVENGANLFAETKSGESPLSKIVGFVNTEILEHILNLYCEHLNKFGTPLDFLKVAMSHGNMRKVVRIVCEWFLRQTNISLWDVLVGVDGKEKSLLHLAARKGNDEGVEYLVVDQEFSKILHLPELKDIVHTAIKQCNFIDSGAIGIIKLLAKYNKGLLNQKDDDGRLPSTMENVEPDVFDALICEGADMSIRDENGDTPFHWIFKNRGNKDKKELVKVCVTNFVDVNVVNLEMETPLLLALNLAEDEATKIDIMKILIDNEADVYVVNRDEVSYLKLLKMNLSPEGYRDLIIFMKNKGCLKESEIDTEISEAEPDLGLFS